MRKAFTMIELIFAIVVIAITVISLPMMMRVNQNAMESNVVQEAVFATSAKMMQVLSYPWDEHSVSSTDPGVYAKIVAIPGGSTVYNRKYNMYDQTDTNGSFRIGAIIEDGHRMFHNYLSPDANITNLGQQFGVDAIDTQSQNNINFSNAAATATGYKNIYTMDVNVSYIPDTGTPFVFSNTGSNTASNMKLVTVDIKDDKGNILTLLRSYSANIGEIDFAKRRF